MAFIMVLSVLLALMVLAGPFLLTAENESAASGIHLARAQARLLAESRLAYARQRLRRGHAAAEAAGGSSDDLYTTPFQDIPAELTVPAQLVDAEGKPLRDADGVPLMYHRDPRGAIVDLKVRDAHSVPNLLGAPPLLIASALGRSTLSAPIGPDDTEISVEDASRFPEKKGVLNIEGEIIPYEVRQGGTFMGCQRGAEGGLKARAHKEDVWVFDDRARQIAMLPFKSPRARGGWREPSMGTFVKEISLTGDRALKPIEVDRLLERFSVIGMRYQAGGFGAPIQLRTDIDPSTYEGNGFDVTVMSNEGFPPGTIVRISDGVNTDYGLVARTFGGFRFGVLRLHEPPEHAYVASRTWVAPLLRHPLNINSAERDVIYECILGVQGGLLGRAAGGVSRVDETAAGIIADGIVEARPIDGFKGLRRVLEDLVAANPLRLNAFQAMAVFRNAVNPNDRNLIVSTVPFSFVSYDRYRIAATAVVNDGGGREQARFSVTERVRVAPPGVLTREFDTQADFEEPIVRTRSARWTTTHPLPVARWSGATSIPADRVLRMLHRFGNAGGLLGGGAEETDDPALARLTGENGLFPDPERGDVRLLPGRVEGLGYVEHFDGWLGGLRDSGVPLDRIDPEGFKLDRGPFEIPPRDRLGASSFGGNNVFQTGPNSIRGRSSTSGALTGRTAANPVRFDLWFNTGSGARSRQVIFDLAGADPNEDRVTLFLPGDGTLRARVHGRTLDDPADGFEEVAETIWEPPSGASFWENHTWYHLGIAYRGTRPEDVLLFVDGFKRGRARYATRLTSSFGPTDASFTVEDAEDWPQRGVAWVGAEVVAYERIGNVFEVVTFDNSAAGTVPWGRGRRGTRRMAHASGEPVSIYGYSVLPRRGGSRRGGLVVPAGGGTLSASLGPPAVLTFAKNWTESLPLPNGQNIQLDLHDPSKPGGDSLVLTAPSPLSAGFGAFPESGGYILIVSQTRQLRDGRTAGGVELAYYQRRNGNTLVGVTSPRNAPNPALAAQTGATPGNQVYVEYQQRLVHTVAIQGQDPVMGCVYPISIAVSNVTGYARPESARQSNEFDTLPEFVQVGNSDLTDLDNHHVEWIRYHHVDPAGHLLLDELTYLRAAASTMLGLVTSNDFSVGDLLMRLVFPMRRQGGTWRLVDNNWIHARGAPVVPCIRTVSFSRRAAIGVTAQQGQMLEAPVNGQRWSPCGYGDSITIEEPRGRGRQLARVAWAGLDSPREEWTASDSTFTLPQGVTLPSVTVPFYPGHGWIALTQSTGRQYRQRLALPSVSEGQRVPPRDRYLRFLKFPSGELPNVARGARAFAAGDLDGNTAAADGRVDELRVTPFEAARYVVWSHQDMDFGAQGTTPPRAVNATDQEIPVAWVKWMLAPPGDPGGQAENQPNAPVNTYILPDGRQIFFQRELQNTVPGANSLPTRDAGLVMIDDEIIAFRELGTGTGGGPALLGCERGFMNTQPTEHGYGANVVFLDFVTVTRLRSGLDSSTRLIEVARADGFTITGGAALIDDEMIHYTQVVRNQLWMPALLDEEGEEAGGLFRGRYGTDPRAHDAEAIVLDMPYRYWDRYVPRQDSAEISYYGFSMDVPGAFFHTISWDEYRPGRACDLVVLCRTEGDVSWAADPGSTPGLFLFQEAEGDEVNLINRTGTRLDVRVFWRFLPGAFNARTMDLHDWKRTPELRSLKVEYLDEDRILSRESRR